MTPAVLLPPPRRLFWVVLAVGIVGLSACRADDDDSVSGDDDDDDATPGALGFEDVTLAWGVDFVAPISPDQPTAPVENGIGDWIAGGGALLIDLTGDETLDLFLTAPHGPNALYLNDGDGFVLRPDSGLEEGPWVFGATAIDLDDDGLRDVLLLADRSVRYMHNEGGGAFEDRGPSSSWASWSDRPASRRWTTTATASSICSSACSAETWTSSPVPGWTASFGGSATASSRTCRRAWAPTRTAPGNASRRAGSTWRATTNSRSTSPTTTGSGGL
jgi:hypothetical protein